MTEETEKTVLQKLMAVNSKPTKETFPELPDALIWRKFCFSFAMLLESI